MSEALDAIHDEALQLLQRENLPADVAEGLQLIMSIARHKTDVRNEQEKEATGFTGFSG
jgi:hypothetical protein